MRHVRINYVSNVFYHTIIQTKNLNEFSGTEFERILSNVQCSVDLFIFPTSFRIFFQLGFFRHLEQKMAIGIKKGCMFRGTSGGICSLCLYLSIGSDRTSMVIIETDYQLYHENHASFLLQIY